MAASLASFDVPGLGTLRLGDLQNDGGGGIQAQFVRVQSASEPKQSQVSLWYSIILGFALAA